MSAPYNGRMTSRPEPATRTRPAAARAITRALAGRCPRCGRGRLYRGPLGLVERCAACGAAADADGSAVTAAMVFGFGVPLLVALPLGFVLIARDAPLAVALGGPAAIVVAAVPAVIRLSKAIWVGLMAAVDADGSAP